jgi:hypothetical protein
MSNILIVYATTDGQTHKISERLQQALVSSRSPRLELRITCTFLARDSKASKVIRPGQKTSIRPACNHRKSTWTSSIAFSVAGTAPSGAPAHSADPY